jgi:hypothetical protein
LATADSVDELCDSRSVRPEAIVETIEER